MTPSETLSTLARADSAALKAFGESLIPDLGEIEVVQSRTGLVMLPLRDTAKGTAFHLGEVLVAEAHITSDGATGYGMRRGRDQEAAMAMALIDLAVARDIRADDCREFCAMQSAALAARDADTLRDIEATRVNMETF